MGIETEQGGHRGQQSISHSRNEQHQRERGSETANQQFSFIICGGPADATTLASKRTVRSQAAKRCSNQRKATMAARYPARKGVSSGSGEGRVAKQSSSKHSSSKQVKSRCRETSETDCSVESSRRASRNDEQSPTPRGEARTPPTADVATIVFQCKHNDECF